MCGYRRRHGAPSVGRIGDYIKEQREHASLSLRRLAAEAGVSNPYLSQVERGLRKPSAEILQQLAKALRISAEQLYIQAGLLEDKGASLAVHTAIFSDPSSTSGKSESCSTSTRPSCTRTASSTNRPGAKPKKRSRSCQAAKKQPARSQPRKRQPRRQARRQARRRRPRRPPKRPKVSHSTSHAPAPLRVNPPSRSSLCPPFPSPLYALVGATDAAAKKARTIPARISELSAGKSASLDLRNIEMPKVDLSKLEMPKVDIKKADPRNANLRQVELPKVDMAAVAGTALEFAAEAERAYEDFVTRGVDVVDRVTGSGDSEAVPETPVATPHSATTAKTAKTVKATPKTTQVFFRAATLPPTSQSPQTSSREQHKPASCHTLGGVADRGPPSTTPSMTVGPFFVLGCFALPSLHGPHRRLHGCALPRHRGADSGGSFAFIDAALRLAQAFVAAGKLTKPAWLVIVGLSTFVLYLFGFISFFGIPALVAVIVYFVDVRPAVRNITRGGSGSVGPYGPW